MQIDFLNPTEGHADRTKQTSTEEQKELNVVNKF